MRELEPDASVSEGALPDEMVRGPFLYRGVDASMHRSNRALCSKAVGPFVYASRYGESTYGGGWTYGVSERNAVLRHQLAQEGFPTAGVSTTPVYERAVFYARHGPVHTRHESGFVYKIDRTKLNASGVREFVVSEFAMNPSVPEDHEVILVAPEGGVPFHVVVEVIAV